ncbi:MAG TPA: hypothetical protein ENI02_02800 [Candidatus Aminicenantes bacterium]|nr:hypothetical protein [Candidatus Aminicenantes bacterium]
MVLDFSKEATEKGETSVEAASDLGRLSNSLDSLMDTLKTFERDVTKTHSNVFREEVPKEKVQEKREEPRNRIIELIDKVEECFEIQRKIAGKFNDFKNLLC